LCPSIIDIEIFQVLNKIFKRINFHGHLRLSGVCKKWHNVVQDDVSFMRTVKFAAGKITKKHKIMRSYRNVLLQDFSKDKINEENLQKLLENAEKIDFGPTTPETLNWCLPLCKNLVEMELNMVADNTALTFVHPLPVKILTTQKISPNVFDRFKTITDISGLVLSEEPSEDFMVKYGGSVTSLTVIITRREGGEVATFDHFGRMENFHLRSLCLWTNGRFEKDSIRSFFGKQAPFVKSFDTKWYYIEDFVFESMWMFLRNLETVKFSFRASQSLCINDLRALTQLKCLDLEVQIGVSYMTDETYHLDIAELITLTELRISCNGGLRISSLHKPVSCIEKLRISCRKFDLIALEQISVSMPGLKVLGIYVKV
jgi:F-box domain